MNTIATVSTKQKLISMGLESFIKGSYSEATTCFKEILSNTPNDTDALHHLAGCQIQLRQHEAAQASIEQALHINPKNPLAWFRLGQIHYACKRYELAIDSFGKAIKIQPDFADAWFMGGQALIQNVDINDGMLALKNALAINPSSIIFNAVFGKCFLQYKSAIGTLVAFGGIEELISYLPFLLENKEKDLKVNVITNFKSADNLFKSLSIPVSTISLYTNEIQGQELQSKILAMREHYQCPKLSLQ